MAARGFDSHGTLTPARGMLLSTITVVGAVLYLVLLWMPLLDQRFNALTAHPEDYADGQFAIAVRLSYLALAIALASLTAALLPARGWAIVGPVLLVAAVLLCAALAVDPIGVARGSQLVLFAIVGLAVAPAVIVLTMRDRFRSWRAGVIVLAIAALAGFVALALVPESVSGLTNRVFDVLIAVWAAIAAISLRRGDAA